MPISRRSILYIAIRNKLNYDFMAEYIILWIIFQLKASNNTNFMTEHILQYAALLFETSKNDLKRAKC